MNYTSPAYLFDSYNLNISNYHYNYTSNNASLVRYFDTYEEMLEYEGIENTIGYGISSSYNKAYLINVEREKERYEKASKQLDSAEIIFSRFSAIDGYKLKITNLDTGRTITGQELKNSGLKTQPGVSYSITYDEDLSNIWSFNYKGHGLSAGEFGIWASNLMIFKESIKNEDAIVLVFEDDITVVDYTLALKKLAQVIGSVPTNFDVLYLDYKQTQGIRLDLEGNDYVSGVSHDFMAYGQWAALYSKKGMEKLLSFDEYTDAIDIFIFKEKSFTEDGLIVYTSEVSIFEPHGDSTIDHMGRISNSTYSNSTYNESCYYDFLPSNYYNNSDYADI